MKKVRLILFYLIGIVIFIMITAKYVFKIDLFTASVERIFCLTNNITQQNYIKLKNVEIQLPWFHWFILKEYKDLYLLQGHYKNDTNNATLLVSIIKDPKEKTPKSILNTTCKDGHYSQEMQSNSNNNFDLAVCTHPTVIGMKPYKIIGIPSKELLIWIEDYQYNTEDEKEYELLINNLHIN